MLALIIQLALHLSRVPLAVGRIGLIGLLGVLIAGHHPQGAQNVVNQHFKDWSGR